MLDEGQLPRRSGVDRVGEIVDRPFPGRYPPAWLDSASLCLALLVTRIVTRFAAMQCRVWARTAAAAAFCQTLSKKYAA